MDSGKRYEIVLRDLESLLQKRLGPETRLLNYDTSPFVKEGENWGSTLLKLQATIEKSAEDKEPTELNLAAKMMPPTDIQRQTFQSLFTFKKEIFLYEELLPKYEEVLGERLDIVPTFFGSRLSLKPDSDEVDDDAVILMENMKLKGYYMTDRFQGLDLEHTRAVITTLAKFHAIGISIKHRAPEFLPRIEKFSKAMVTGVEATRPMLDMVLTAIKGDPEIGPEFYEKIKATCDPADLSTYYTQLAVDHPWACVVHNDLWNNNVLLHKNAEGHVDDCKLVDFQTYYTSSPLTDLVFLLCTSSRTPHEYFDEIVETYRAEAARVLSKLDCPEALELFTPEKFDERLRLDASGELFHVIEFTKIVEQREGESYEETPPNEHTMRRLRSIFKVYKRKQWI